MVAILIYVISAQRHTLPFRSIYHEPVAVSYTIPSPAFDVMDLGFTSTRQPSSAPFSIASTAASDTLAVASAASVLIATANIGGGGLGSSARALASSCTAQNGSDLKVICSKESPDGFVLSSNTVEAMLVKNDQSSPMHPSSESPVSLAGTPEPSRVTPVWWGRNKHPVEAVMSAIGTEFSSLTLSDSQLKRHNHQRRQEKQPPQQSIRATEVLDGRSTEDRDFSED
ncbi:unnamed protein product [Protopolystoma xenopodis]|uniref:Uncharacterized protein n=1 Tax=Protopolystoma xenopodis TaxID=117903 RepID=A0A448WM03_9PLAT|nr:unnamed protein product [Protopolystoma xenopodis]